jgi:nucleotide-binding universal stress UspA family protein
MIAPGKAAEKILEVAKEEEFDLIVMGSTGIGSIGSFLLGSTSSRVKANADVPVKVINEDGDEVEPTKGLLQ